MARFAEMMATLASGSEAIHGSGEQSSLQQPKNAMEDFARNGIVSVTVVIGDDNEETDGSGT